MAAAAETKAAALIYHCSLFEWQFILHIIKSTFSFKGDSPNKCWHTATKKNKKITAVRCYVIHSIVKMLKTKGIYGRPRFRPLIHTFYLFSTYSYIVYWWWYCTVLYSHHLWSPLSSYWPYKKVENLSFFFTFIPSRPLSLRNIEMMLEVVRLTYFPWQKKQHPADNNHFVKKKKREFEKVNDEETRK